MKRIANGLVAMSAGMNWRSRVGCCCNKTGQMLLQQKASQFAAQTEVVTNRYIQ